MLKHTQSQVNNMKINPYVEYVNRFKEIIPMPTNLAHFHDGIVLLELIRMITDMTIEGEIQDNPKTFFHRFSNLKLLFHSIEHFWEHILGCPLIGDEIDLVLIAHTANSSQTQRLLQLFVKTATQAQNKCFFIEKILQTSQSTQQYLKQIIEVVISNNRDSPRKQKEARMYDKIMQLDHQNQRLQQLIEQICQQKLQFETRLKTITDRFEQRNKEIERLQVIVDEQMYTPQKRKIIGVPDTIDRKDSQIQSLRQQMLEMSALHEKQLQQCFNEMEKMVDMNNHVERLKLQLEHSKETIQNSREVTVETQRTITILKADLMSKENIVSLLKERLEKSQLRCLELERAEMLSKSELERRNVQLNEVTSKLEYLQRRLSPIKGEQNRNNLYLEFPGLAEAETDVYIETNRNLREELERTRRRLESNETELQHCRRILDSLKNCEQQNRKLRQMVLDLKSHRGEEIDILVGSLHYLRKLIPKNNKGETALKDCNGVSRSLFTK